jgi:hypothetical protein
MGMDTQCKALLARPQLDPRCGSSVRADGKEGGKYIKNDIKCHMELNVTMVAFWMHNIIKHCVFVHVGLENISMGCGSQWSHAHGHGELCHLLGRGLGAPLRLVTGGAFTLAPRLAFSARQTGRALLRPSLPPHRLLRLPPPNNFASGNSSSSVVVAISGALQ